MNNNYLIPANSKKSQLWLGFLTPLDALIFGGGILLTLTLLLVIQNANMGAMILILLPALITGFLVIPLPYYHNILQFIINIYSFYSNNRRYLWRGWWNDGEK